MVTAMKNFDAFVEAKEAAAIVGCTVGRIHQMARSGVVKAIKIAGKAWLIDRKDAERYARDVQPTGRPRKFSE